MKRDHASLCSYNPKQNPAKTGSPLATGVKRQRSPESEGSLRKEENRWPRTNGKSHIPIQEFRGGGASLYMALSGEDSELPTTKHSVCGGTLTSEHDNALVCRMCRVELSVAKDSC